MKNILTALMTGFMLLSLGGAASAGTLDFTEYGSFGLTDATTINLSNATLTSFGGGFYINAVDDLSNSYSRGATCAVRVNRCDADWQIDFFSDVSNLFFSGYRAASGDSVEISAYLDGNFLGSTVVTENSNIDMSAFGAIDHLFFDDNSTAFGIGFNDFSFDTVSVVPLPSSLPLYGAGLAIIGFVGWRRRQRQTKV